MGLAIAITVAIGIISVLIILSFFLSSYKLANECDMYKSIMCYADWKCYFGTTNANNEVIGDISGTMFPGGNYDGPSNPTVRTDPTQNTTIQALGLSPSVEMECYIRGLYGNIDNSDGSSDACAGFYQRDPNACTSGQGGSNADLCDSKGGANTESDPNNPFGCACTLGSLAGADYSSTGGANNTYDTNQTNSGVSPGSQAGMNTCGRSTFPAYSDTWTAPPCGGSPGQVLCSALPAFLGNPSNVTTPICPAPS